MTMEGVTSCAACGRTATVTDLWCERCGEALDTRPMEGMTWLSSAVGTGSCPVCGAPEPVEETACGQCGSRWGRVRDHATLDLGVVAGTTDVGLRRERNEDAITVGRYDAGTMAVVCDGVGSVPGSDQAALRAAEVGIRALFEGITKGGQPATVTEDAITAAARTVRELADGSEPGNAPSCTYVSALVTGEAVTIGWIGDSRAYWVPDPVPVVPVPVISESSVSEPSASESVMSRPEPAGAALLTVDDTLAGRFGATGIRIPGEVDIDPRAHALLQWLGADAGMLEPHVVEFTPPRPGLLVVCSDGLSRYLDGPDTLAEAIQRAVPGVPRHRPAEVAGALTRLALEAGGVDNITVAVLPVPSVRAVV